jgi:hypothetical protein
MNLQETIQLEINGINNSRVGNKTDKQLHLFLKARPIKQYSLTGELIAEYPSKSLAEKKLGIELGRLEKAFTIKRNNSYGFIWRYADEELVMKQPKKSGPKLPQIEIYDISGRKISTVSNSMEVCKFLNVPYVRSNIGHISNCLNGRAITFKNHFLVYENIQEKKAVFQKSKTQSQKIEQYTFDGELVASYSTLTDAAQSLGYNRSTLSRYIKLKNGKYNGYIFKVLNLSHQE